MIWKTCSVEAGGGISKSRRLGGVRARPSRAGASFRDPERSLRRISRGNALVLFTQPFVQPRFALRSSPRVSGMQKHGLTMFARTCYSSLVPRVHPGLQCAVGFAVRICAQKTCGGALEKREVRFRIEVQVRKLSSLKRTCGAFRPIVEGYAGQG